MSIVGVDAPSNLGLRPPRPGLVPGCYKLPGALRDQGLDRIWVHVDADVLDPSVMPAVDSPEPDGLLPDELVEALVPLLRDPRVTGMDLAIYDPDLDEAGDGARLLADVLVEALAAAGRS